MSLSGSGAHEGEAGPPVEVVGVVGEAAAELAVGDLAVVDPPVDLVFEHAEVFDLEEGPLGNSGGCGGEREGRLELLGVLLGPVFAAEIVGGIDAEEVGDVGVEAVVEVKLAGVDRLFGHVGVVVADLGEAVGDVLGEGVVVGLEDEADLRAFEGVGAEVGAGGGDGDVEALEVGEDAVAGVEPEGVGLAGFDGEVEVEHVAHRPDGIFDLDVHGDGVAVRGFEIEGGEIDGDAVESGVHVLPAVGVAVSSVGLEVAAEVAGDENVDDGERGGLGGGLGAGLAGSCACGAAAGAGDHDAAFVGGEATGDEGLKFVERWVVDGVVGGDGEGELGDAGGLGSGVDVVGGELADGPLILYVGEADALAGDGLGELVAGAARRLRAAQRGWWRAGVRCLPGRGRLRLWDRHCRE